MKVNTERVYQDPEHGFLGLTSSNWHQGEENMSTSVQGFSISLVTFNHQVVAVQGILKGTRASEGLRFNNIA